MQRGRPDVKTALSIALVALAGAMCVLGPRPYAEFLAWATAGTRAILPPAEAPVAVQAAGGTLRVVGAHRVASVRAAGIAWNLPILIALWACVVRRRWPWLAGSVGLLVLLHVAVADIEIRKVVDDPSGPAYGFTRAWIHGGSALLAVALVATAWALPARSRRRPGPA